MSITTSSAVANEEKSLTITRVFDAPRELVYRAWTDPVHIGRWMGPRGFTAPHIEQDFRPGGVWQICLRSDDGSDDLWQSGIYREIVEPERLVFTFAWVYEGGKRGHETLITLNFTEKDGKTEMIFRQATFQSVEVRDDHEGGWNSCFDRLEEHLEMVTE